MRTRYVLSRYSDAMRGRNPSVEAWTAVTDIGGVFNRRVLHVSEYLTEESRLIEAAARFAEEVGVEAFVLVNAHASDDPDEQVEMQRSSPGAMGFGEGQRLRLLEACDALRYMLREELSGLLQADALAVYAGFDFYLHIDADRDCPKGVEWARSTGLTVCETRVDT